MLEWLRSGLTFLAGQRPSWHEAEQAVCRCVAESVRPALERVRDELATDGWDVDLEAGDDWACLRVAFGADQAWSYCAEGRIYHPAAFAFPALHGHDERPRVPRLRMTSGGSAREWNLASATVQAIADDCRSESRKWLARGSGGAASQ